MRQRSWILRLRLSSGRAKSIGHQSGKSNLWPIGKSYPIWQTFNFGTNRAIPNRAKTRSILISPQLRFLPIGKREQSGTWTSYLKSSDKVSGETFLTRSIGRTLQSGQTGKSCNVVNRENMPIGPIRKTFQSGQSGKPSNRTNRESTPIWPIGKVFQSGKSGKPSNLANRESLPIWPIGKAFQSGKPYNRANRESNPILPIGTTLQSGKPCNQDNREGLAIGPIWKVLQSGQLGKAQTANENKPKDIAQHLLSTGNNKSLPLPWHIWHRVWLHQAFC